MIEQSLNETTPEFSTPVQNDESVAPFVPVPGTMEMVTGERSVVTTTPFLSSTATTGWVVKALPAVAPAGCWTNWSCSASEATSTGGG